MDQLLARLQDQGIDAETLALAQEAQAEKRQLERTLQENSAQAARDEARRAVDMNRTLWTTVQYDHEVKQLLAIIENTTVGRAKKLLNAGKTALERHLNGVPDGEQVKLVKLVYKDLAERLQKLPANGYFGKKRAKAHALALRVHLNLVPETIELYEVDDDNDDNESLDIVLVRDEEDNDLADDEGLPPLPDRPQTEPSDSAPENVKLAFRIIMGIPKLRSSIRFELVPFLSRVHDNIVENITATNTTLHEPHKLMMGGGKCQSRKTPLKVCMFIMGRLLGVSTLLLTTGTSGRDDLFVKFTDMLSGSELPSPHPYTAPQHEFAYGFKRQTDTLTSLDRLPAGQPRQAPLILRHGTIGGQVYKTDWAVEQLLQGVCLVANNSCQAMMAAVTLLESARTRAASRDHRPFQFLLIIDEADDFYRTEAGTSENDDGAIQMEKAMKRLRQLAPLIKFDVSATLFAIYLTLVKIGRADEVPFDDIFYVEASAEYVGTERFMCPENSAGDPVFLTDNELKKDNLYINDKVEALWESAAQTVSASPAPPAFRRSKLVHAWPQERALVLDATTSAVNAEGNIYQKADKLLDKYKHAIAIVVSGGKIEWRTYRPLETNPEDGRGWGAHLYKGKEKMFGPILETIDRRYPKRPIFVFGYSQLMRGLSYRSKRRVPSHYVLLYGKSMSICRLVQAAGRAHGDQARILQENGFNQVTILTKAHDFDTIKNYPSFLEAIKIRMAPASEGGEGITLQAALQQKFRAKFNFSGRIDGAKKTHLNELKQELLEFHPVQAGELPGAEAADAEVTGFSAKRVVVEVLRGGLGYDDIDENAMTTTDILAEIRATREYDDYLGNDKMPVSTTEIGNILTTLTQPLKSLNLPALVDRFEGLRPTFHLNYNVLDVLEVMFAMPVSDGTPILAPPALSRQPTPRGSVGEAESQDLYEVEYGDEQALALDHGDPFAYGDLGAHLWNDEDGDPLSHPLPLGVNG